MYNNTYNLHKLHNFPVTRGLRTDDELSHDKDNVQRFEETFIWLQWWYFNDFGWRQQRAPSAMTRVTVGSFTYLRTFFQHIYVYIGKYNLTINFLTLLALLLKKVLQCHDAYARYSSVTHWKLFRYFSTYVFYFSFKEQNNSSISGKTMTTYFFALPRVSLSVWHSPLFHNNNSYLLKNCK